MRHGAKRFLCLIIMGLAFAYFLSAVLHRQFLWVAVAVLVVIFCVHMFLRMENKDKRKMAEMIANNQTLDATVEAWEKNSTDARGEQFLLLLSFDVDGKSHHKGYELKWSQSKEHMNKYMDKYPVGSIMTLLYTPKELETLMIQKDKQILSEVSDYTFKRFFSTLAAEK